MAEEQGSRKGVTVGQALGTIVVLLGVIITFYSQTQVRLNTLEIRMNEKEKADQLFNDQFEKINAKLDHMQLEMFDIKVEVMKKADKKD